MASRTLCFSPDSKLLAVAGPASSILIIDTKTRRTVTALEGHHNIVATITFFRTTMRFVTGAILTKDFKCLRTIQDGGQENGRKEEMITAIAIATDEEYVAVGFMNGTVGLYVAAFAQPMSSFQAHPEFLFHVAISPKALIATASHDKTARLWVIRGVPTCRRVLAGHTYCVLTLAFSPTEGVLFTGSKDETIKCWSEETGENLFTLTGHKNTVFQIDHHPHDRTIVCCSGDGIVSVWDYTVP
jgi:WD40 repeat protein